MATKITPEIIELIKKYRIENKLGSGKLSEILKANHDLDVGRSTITKILKKLKDQGVKGIAIPMSELASSVAQRLDPDIPPARSGKRKIYQLDINNNIIKEWNTIKDAYETLKLSRTSINHVLSGENKTSGGYHWCYKEEYNKRSNLE